MTSYSSSQYTSPGKACLGSLESGFVYEAIAVFRGPDGIYAAPVGVWIEEGSFRARIYPGSRLAEYFTREHTVCICFTLDPTLFYKSLILHRIDAEPGLCSQAYCPANCSLAVECSIDDRPRPPCTAVEPVTVRLTPLCCRHGSRCTGYSRVLGCSIELLIAVSRITYFARIRACSEAAKWCTLGRVALNCIKHTDRRGTIARVAEEVLRRAVDLAEASSCPCRD
ncbi:MAG: DUF447 family protein [Crenarchaeota archaeon]|nr:DUF447 family protein [Thermoproteota archaeon]